MTRYIDLVFDAPPGPGNPRLVQAPDGPGFVEAEDDKEKASIWANGWSVTTAIGC